MRSRATEQGVLLVLCRATWKISKYDEVWKASCVSSNAVREFQHEASTEA